MTDYTVIFRATDWDDDIEKLAECAKRCGRSGTFVIAIDESDGTVDVDPYLKLSHSRDFSSVGLLGIPTDRVLWWNGDAILYLARNTLPHTEYYVMLTSDVLLGCELDGVIKQVSEDGIDFAACKIESLPETRWSRSSIRGIAADPYHAFMPLTILSGRAIDLLLETRRKMANDLRSGAIEQWPYWETFIPTVLLQRFDMSVCELDRFVNTDLMRRAPVMSISDPLLSRPGIAAHPVMSGFRFVRAFISSEPIPRPELWYGVSEEFVLYIHALFAANGVNDKGKADDPYSLQHFQMVSPIGVSNGSTGNLALVLEDLESQELLVKTVLAVVREKVFGARPEFLNADIDKLSFLAAGVDSSQYAVEHMMSAQRFGNSDLLRDHAIACVAPDGLILEFGVFAGHTINQFAKRLPDRQIFGFDSFEGLPEAWEGMPKGAFKPKKLPDVKENVELIIGWFDTTLPQFLEQHPNDPVALLHIDSDLYSSANTVLTLLAPMIDSGTLIIFDEYFNYPGWRRHEFKAFQEFANKRQLKYEYLGIVPSQEQVLVRIV
jgi:hypothetical protein